MGPRPMASRDDETAAAFLDAGSALIDAMLAADRSGPLPARLRQLHYPAPLEWIRIEDVLRIVGGSAQAGRKAFYNRWPTKDDYIRDCFIRVRNVAWGIAAGLLNDPRASLLSHAGSRAALRPASRTYSSDRGKRSGAEDEAQLSTF